MSDSESKVSEFVVSGEVDSGVASVFSGVVSDAVSMVGSVVSDGVVS